MEKRSPIKVFLLPFITFGIYSLYWEVKTKGEMNKLGEKIPTAWIILIPIVGAYYFHWKYAEGVEHVTNAKMSKVIAFVLLILLGNIGQAIIQDSFNELGGTAGASLPASAPVVDPAAPIASTAPTVTPATTPESTPPKPPVSPVPPVSS